MIKRSRREHNERAWLAWHIAALTRAAKMPKLKDLMAEDKRAKAPVPWQQQQARMSAWISSKKKGKK